MSIQVTACLNPFSTERSEFTFEQEISVSGIIKKLDALHAVNTGWRVLIDDEIVTDFSRVPKDGQHVYVKLVPEGDNQSTGTGMKIGGGALVALGVVVGVLTHWTGVGAFAGAAMVGAGIGLLSGGVVLYSTDIPSLTNKNRETPEQDPSIRGSQNQMRPYGVVPTLFGKRRIYTDLASKSYTWVEDGSMYLYQLFCVGQKDMMIDKDSIKIDETLLTDYSSTGNINSILAGNDPLIDMRIHQDGTMPVLYDKCVHEDQVNAILKNKTEEGIDGSVIRTTPDGTQEINVDIFFYNGLGKYSNDGNLGETSVTIGAWYKKAEENDSEYKPLGKFKKDGLHPVAWLFSVVLPKSLKASSENIWAFYSNWNKLNGPDQLPNPGFKKYYGLSVYSTTNNEFGWTKTVRFVVNDLAGVTTNAETEITGAELKTKRYSIHLTSLEAASYTIKLSRLSDDSSDSKVIDDVYVGSIRAVKNENPVRPERASQLTIVELKIKASEKLNQVVKQLNFIAESKLPVYLGYGTGTLQWRYAQSRNPASAAIYAMQGEVAQQKLSDSEIDWPAFEKLYTWCVAHQYECNAYITESISISGLLSAIASTCRAEIVRLNGKITVIQDIERDSFVQIFTPRNSHDYSENIALGDVPDALNLNFVDSDAGFAQGQARIYNTPNGNYAGEPETTQDVELWGVTNSEQARKLGMYKYAVTNHRALIHRFSVDFEYLMCTKGDWIKYAGDIALAGITQGRIQEVIKNAEGLVIGVMCDEEIPIESGKNYGLRVRKSTGEALIFYLQTTISENPRMIFFQTPTTEELAPHSGDLFTFGEAKGANLEDSIDLIITDIQCGENLSADLTCVEYSPEIFGVDEDGFVLPDYESKISDVAGARDVIDMGMVTPDWKTFFTYHDGEEAPEPASGDGTNAGWHYAKTRESLWVSTKTARNVYEGVWSAPTYTKGEKGDKGDKGDTGATGPQGAKGDAGASFHWNLLPDTNDLTKWPIEANVSCTKLSEAEPKFRIDDLASRGGHWGIFLDNVSLKNVPYTLSYKAAGPHQISLCPHGSFQVLYSIPSASPTSETEFKVTFTPKEGTYRIYIHTPGERTQDYFDLGYLKLEEGSTASDWCTTQSETKGDTGATGPQGAKGDAGASFHWNLLPDTNDLTKWPIEANVSCTKLSEAEPKFRIDDLASRGGHWGIFLDNVSLKNVPYTLSYKAAGPHQISLCPHGSFQVLYSIPSASPTSETEFKVTFTPKEGTYRIYIHTPGERTQDYFDLGYLKLEEGSTASDWCTTQSETKGENGNDGKGIGLKINYSFFSTANTGEIYVHGYSNGSPADVDGFVYYSGVKVSVAKTMINPDVAMEGWIAIPATGGAAIPVYYDLANSQWKNMQTGANSDINGDSYLAIAEFINSTDELTETAALIEPILLSSLAKQIPANYIGIAGTVTDGNCEVTLYNTTNSYEFASLGTKKARTGDCVFCRGVLTPLTGASDSVKALRVYNGYSWQAPKAQDYAKYRDLAMLDLAAGARVYKKAGVSIPTDIDTVFDILVTNQLLTEKLTSYEAFINNLFSDTITLNTNWDKAVSLGTPLNGFKSKDFSEDEPDYSSSDGYYTENVGFKRGFSLYDYIYNRNNVNTHASRMLLDYLSAYEIKANDISGRYITSALIKKGTVEGESMPYTAKKTILGPYGLRGESRSSPTDTQSFDWNVEHDDNTIINNKKGDWLSLKAPNGFFFRNKALTIPPIYMVFNQNGSTKAEQQGIIEHGFGTNNGYIRYANGLVIQWGYNQIGTNTSASTSVSYPVQGAFTSTPIVTGVPKTSGLDTNHRLPFQIYDVGKDSFTVYGNFSTTFGINWIAIGH